MDLQVHNKDFSGYGSSKNMPRKAKGQNNTTTNQMYSNKGRSVVTHVKTNKKTQDNYSQHKQYTYPSWSTFSEERPVRKSSFSQNSGNYSYYQTQSNYAKNSKTSYIPSYSSDKYSSWSTQNTTGSDSDSNMTSELKGFKIMQNGKVVHNETHDEVETVANMDQFFMEDLPNEKFASSLMTIGPNSKEISLPSFA